MERIPGGKQTKHEAIRKTDVFFNAFITEEISDQKKRIGADNMANMLEKGKLTKFMEVSGHVTNKLDIISGMHEARQVQLRKAEAEKDKQKVADTPKPTQKKGRRK